MCRAQQPAVTLWPAVGFSAAQLVQLNASRLAAVKLADRAPSCLFTASLGTVFWSPRSHTPAAQRPAVFSRGTGLVPVDASSRLHTAVNAAPQVPATTPPVGVAVGVRVMVGVAVGVPVAVAVGVRVGVAVAVGVAVTVAVGVRVGVTVAVGVAVAIAVGVSLAVGISVAVGVVVPVEVAEGVAVDEGDGAGVSVDVTVGGGVSIGVGDAVGLELGGDAVGVTPGASDRARKKCGWFRVTRAP